MTNSALKSERHCYSIAKEKSDNDLKKCYESSSGREELSQCYKRATEKNDQRKRACMYSHVI